MKSKILLSALSISVVLIFFLVQHYYRPAIKVGIMHSLSGNMAISESSMVDAVTLAIEEINESGGLLGRKIETIVRDGKSDPKVFAQVAETLITEENVEVVFGCWTSSCRKSVLPIFEKHKHLLYYPLQYEGIESSKHIIYLGAVPNQQVIPALEWAFSELGRNIYLIGSDYVYPRAANEIIRDKITKWRGNIVGETYIPLGSDDFSDAVKEIKTKQPDVIFSTINGRSNLSFFKKLRNQGITPDKIPTFSFSISEDELANFSDISMQGDYLVWNYIQQLDNKNNALFVKKFKSRFGEERQIGNPMMTAYLGVHLWAKAVSQAHTSKVKKVFPHASDLSIQGPSGMIYIDKNSHHTWKSIHIAQIQSDHSLKTVWHSKVPIAPSPYPESRTKLEWETYLNKLYQNWGNNWQAPIASE